MLLELTLVALAVAALTLVRAAVEARPPTRVEPVTELLHGVPVTDPYRWLEGDLSDPDRPGTVTAAVAAWTDAQNAHTRAVLDRLPGRAELEARLRPLLEVGTVTRPTVRGGRYFFSKREGAAAQPSWYWREGALGADRLLLDPMTLDPSGLTTVAWVSPSEDGRLAAYGTYRAGDENTILRLMAVDSGRCLTLEIPNKVEAPDWLPDGSGFVYHHWGDAHDPYSGRVRFHRLGSDPAADPVLLRQLTREEDERLATTWGPSGSLSRDGRWLVLVYFTSTRSNDLWVADFDAYRKSGTLERREVTVGGDGLAAGTVVDGTLYLHTTDGAPNGRIFAVDPLRPARSAWREIVPERSDAVHQGFSVAAGRLVLVYLESAATAIRLAQLDGTPIGPLRLPPFVTAAIGAEPESSEAFVEVTGFDRPTTIFRVDLERPDAAPETWACPPVPLDPSRIVVEQVDYPSRDGTRVSMFVVHRRGLARDGERPTILTGYGGFNVAETPSFLPTLFPWLEDGGVYALANLRGGGERGDSWHEAGILAKKQNVFDDFAAAAEWLVARGYTNPSKLACAGGSNGGLLTGAMVTQHPELFRAALVAVPLLDMLRYERFLMARYWVPEYGSAEDPEQFRTLLAYSPYHHVVAGADYPAVLLTAGENDVRVHALHARKMAARLQAATAADPAAKPVLLWVDREAGHGQGKPLASRLRDLVDQRLFLRWQLGMPATPPASAGRAGGSPAAP